MKLPSKWDIQIYSVLTKKTKCYMGHITHIYGTHNITNTWNYHLLPQSMNTVEKWENWWEDKEKLGRGKRHHWQLSLLWFPAFSDVTVKHRSVRRCCLHNPSLFCIAIWEKPLAHLMNTCHMLTLRITATRPENPARLRQWQTDGGSKQPVFTSSHDVSLAVWLGPYNQYKKV